jgi:Cu2+-exporting ATPase
MNQHHHLQHKSDSPATKKQESMHAHHHPVNKMLNHDEHEMNPPHGHEGHDHHAMMIEEFKKRFWISLILSVPVLLLSEMIQHWLGFELKFAGDNYLLLVLSSVIFFYGGWPFLKGLTEELKTKSPGMMTLIALAITVAYVFSVAVIFGFDGMDFFWEVATLIVIMLLGHWLEMKSVLGASKALQMLVSMMPAEANLIHGDHIMGIKLEDLKIDDIILIKPGEKVPADGIVVIGESYFNESMLTGESKPVKKGKNDKVIGGSLNGNGSVRVRVLHTGKDSYLNKVITLVQEAQKAKSRTQHLADRAAKWLTYIALGVGFITLVVWLALGQGTNYAIERMVTVMVISCPHALGLAIPLVVAISTALSAQQGLLIRNRTAFENSRKITTIVFDKTGTLTKGDFGVTRIESVGSISKNELLQLAASLEQSSEHPIAIGIMKKAKEAKLDVLKTENFFAITGKGIEALVNGKNVKVVSPGFLKEKRIPVPAGISSNDDETIVFVLLENQLTGYIALADEIRPESKQAIESFKRIGIKVMMATGDNEKVAKAVASELRLDGYFAEVLPHQKVEIVKELQSKNEFVAMTGDGVNDAPALAQADVGIAIGSGTDVAAETADIILVNSNPNDILNLIMFGKATYRKMVQNLIWATGYNAIAIPLAAGVLAATGFVLDPAIGAVFMSLSTIIVVLNAQLLKRQIHYNKNGVT